MVTLSLYCFQVGDQILRVNGYPVEDAVHQEVALLAKNQQVLVLKIRSNYLCLHLNYLREVLRT
jgi:hypothetical protein